MIHMVTKGTYFFAVLYVRVMCVEYAGDQTPVESRIMGGVNDNFNQFSPVPNNDNLFGFLTPVPIASSTFPNTAPAAMPVSPIIPVNPVNQISISQNPQYFLPFFTPPTTTGNGNNGVVIETPLPIPNVIPSNPGWFITPSSIPNTITNAPSTIASITTNLTTPNMSTSPVVPTPNPALSITLNQTPPNNVTTIMNTTNSTTSLSNPTNLTALPSLPNQFLTLITFPSTTQTPTSMLFTSPPLAPTSETSSRLSSSTQSPSVILYTSPNLATSTPATTSSTVTLLSTQTPLNIFSTSPISTTSSTTTIPSAANPSVFLSSSTPITNNTSNVTLKAVNTTTIIDSIIKAISNLKNNSFLTPILAVEPPEITISLSINPIVFNITQIEPPTEVVEIFTNTSANDVRVQVVTTADNIRPTRDSSLNIDLSGTAWETTFGITTPIANVPSSTAQVIANKIYQQKCNDYYGAGRRFARRARVQVMIVGGIPSNEREFPHMAALGYGRKHENKFLCGGSLISDKFVLTAAHCLSAPNIGDIQYVRLGTTTLQTETLNSQDYNVLRKIPYPAYIPGQQYNDIALVELENPVNFSDFVAPICLYDGPSSFELQGSELTATGWGRTDPTDGDQSPVLQKVQLNYFSYSTCNRSYSNIPKDQLPYGIQESTQLCAGTLDGSRDTCQGDSGGPLQIQQDGRLYLVGITSFGIGCATPGVPGVYTKVSTYLPWIVSTIWGG